MKLPIDLATKSGAIQAKLERRMPKGCDVIIEDLLPEENKSGLYTELGAINPNVSYCNQAQCKLFFVVLLHVLT